MAKKFSLWNDLNHWGLLDPSLKQATNWWVYLRQSLMALVFLLGFLWLWLVSDLPLHDQVIFAAIGSSTFLVFASPSRYSSNARPLIGGHFIGVVVGLILWHVRVTWMPGLIPDAQMMMLSIAVSVSLTIFFMTIVDAEHPPAAGTALAFAVHDQQPDLNAILFVMGCAGLLALIRYGLWKRRWLRDLI
jgi:CBS-domain-containing membrane protein